MLRPGRARAANGWRTATITSLAIGYELVILAVLHPLAAGEAASPVAASVWRLGDLRPSCVLCAKPPTRQAAGTRRNEPGRLRGSGPGRCPDRQRRDRHR